MRADRLLAIMMRLQTGGKMTTAALAAEVGVSRRTILRDVEALALAGVPIYAEGGHGGGVALDEGYRTSLTGLREAEVRSLFIANNSELLHEVGLGEAAESSLLKLLAALPALHQPSVDFIRQRIYIDPLWWWHERTPVTFWAELQQAVYEDRYIEATYENRTGELVERRLEPYSLVAKSSLWYLVARREGEMRTYRVSRIHRLRLLDEHFERAADFDLAHFWQTHVETFAATIAEYHFVVRLHESRLNFAQWLTPGRFQIVEAADAEGWLSAAMHVETMELAKMLVFGLGRDVVVIEPAELREAVLATARMVVEREQR
ncbi:MAG: WYL domain-containing protein [Anaerolineae bacterium]|nr:WYL domain-containing protein [Anaerolineae bacterium]